MKSKFSSIIAVMAALLLITACTSNPLPRGTWNDQVYSTLNELIRDCKGNPDAYAVLDFDNTTVINDISVTAMIWQIENLRFKIKPDSLYTVLTAFVPDIDQPLEGSGLTTRELAADIIADYNVLYGCGKTLDELLQVPEYLDFRAKLWALSLGIDTSFGYEAGLLWMPNLYAGMTYSELRQCILESVAHWEAHEMTEETWTSPDGKASVTVKKGLRLPQISVDLYNALTDNGIEVYFCSASLEQIVEALACAPDHDLGVSEENVFGVRFDRDCSVEDYDDADDSGVLQGVMLDGYVMPYKMGKVECIKNCIAPLHGGADPVLIAGDSNGDYYMLTGFPDLKVGLIFDVGNSGKIGELRDSARLDTSKEKLRSRTTPKYVVQER